MKIETTYSKLELKKGKCKSCSEMSNEILIDDGRCVDCIEEEKFFDECMKQSNHKSPFGMFS